MNILHLSDIHFGRNDPAYGLKDPFAKHDQILEELIQTVSALDEELRPNHIVFTGDIAWHGKRTEFAEAYEWFSRLLDALRLEGKDISFCVGNHDVDWGYRCIDTGMNDDSLEQISHLYRYENVHLLEPSIYAYDEFCRRLGMIPYAYPNNGKREYSYSVGYKDVPFSCGRTIRLISLNTSLLIAQPGISEDKMWLGQEQLRSLIEYGILPADDSIWYTVMLYHHSDRFLHPNETSTYNGRSATLPMMMSYADLLLCGHTESSGRPRLTKQLGGGVLLSAGASYYSDDHHNAFSMLYISDERPTAGFLPYVYDNGWKDYDFEQPEIDAVHCHDLPAEGKMLQNVSLRFTAAGQTHTLPMNTLNICAAADGGISIHNRMDFLNHFSLQAQGRPGAPAALHLTIAENWRNFLRARFSWKDYDEFYRKAADAADARWQLLAEDGTELLSGSGLPELETLPFEDALMDSLRRVEFYFDVRFTLPGVITEQDRQKLEILTDLAVNGCTSRIPVDKTQWEDADGNALRTAAELLGSGDTLVLRSKEKCSVTLFGVNISFGTVDVLSGPYRIDRKDLQKKLDSYCEGDIRRLRFDAAPDVQTWLIQDPKAVIAFAAEHLPILDIPHLPLILED